MVLVSSSSSSYRSYAASFIIVAAGISLTLLVAAAATTIVESASASAAGSSSEGEEQTPQDSSLSEDASCLVSNKEQQHERVMEYHYAVTTSTQDSAKELIASWNDDKNNPDEADAIEGTTTPRTGPFVVTAWQQTNGRGTSERRWWGAPGNTFATVCIKQDDWTATRLPLTLMPLLVGLLVAKRVEQMLLFDDSYYCPSLSSSLSSSSSATSSSTSSPPPPLVTVKWPNDVLVNDRKIAGVLIEASSDWFLIGIGVNVAFAPDVPSSGPNRGRPATSIAEHSCLELDKEGKEVATHRAASAVVARKLGVDLAEDLVQWLLLSTKKKRNVQQELLQEWNSWFDWDSELVLRDSEHDGEYVVPQEILPDGRLVVQNRDGTSRVMVSDYFL